MNHNGNVHANTKEKQVNEYPVLPYAGTSGWSGTDTSQTRATERDNNGTTQDNQVLTYAHLKAAGAGGLTWKELSEKTGWHHGTASGVLSVLHKNDRIARLVTKRARCRIYVTKLHVYGRATDSQGRKSKECPNCGYFL